MERQHKSEFESAFQGAFQEAEITPSAGLWDRIESDLERKKSSGYKKRLLFFQLMAAASFALAMTVGGILISDYYFTNNEQAVTSLEKKENEPTKSKDEKAGSERQPAVNNNSSVKPGLNVGNNIDKDNGETEFGTLKNQKLNTRATAQAIKPDDVITSDLNFDDHQIMRDSDNKEEFLANKIDRLFSFLKTNKLSLKEPEHLTWLAYSEPSNRQKPDRDASIWTGLNMAAGSFSSDNQGSDVYVANSQSEFLSGSNAGDIADVGDEERGRSFSIGLNIGSTIGKRFVLLSGVNYLEQNTFSNSNITSEARAVSSFEDLRTGNSIEFVDSYEVNNTYTSIAVPVQVGYYLVDKKLDVLLLGGVSNDFFINKLSSSGEGIGENKFTSQDDGYSLYSIGAIVGTQVSYELGNHYSVAIQPQYKKQITTFTPQEIRPNGFELGVRLNYIFK